MSREILEEIISELEDAEKDEVSALLNKIMEYNFADDIKIAELLKIDSTDLDDLLTYSGDLTNKQTNSYCRALIRFLSNENKKYERIYYKQK